MRKLVLALMLTLMVGCAAPQSIIVATERSQVNAVKYQENMTKIVLATVKAYETSEKKRLREDHYKNLDEMAARSEGHLSPTFVKVQTELLISKLRKVDDQIATVKIAMAKAQVDFDRFVELTQMVNKYLKSSGMQPEHIAIVRDIFEDAADAYIENKRVENSAKIEAALAELGKIGDE